MHINKIQIKNFRLLQDATLDMRKDLSLLLGKNNSGKTSFMVIFEKFYENSKFTYNDFPLSLRDKIVNIEKHNENISIEMRLEIEYEDTDNLEKLSEFILDLDVDCKTVKIFFEVSIDRLKLMNKLQNMKKEDRERFLTKHLSPPLLSKKIYIYENENDIKQRNWIEKKLEDIKKIINFQIIHAKRDVSSSEEKSEKKKALSTLSTKYFNQKNKDTDFNDINEALIKMDKTLDEIYDKDFSSFVKNSKKILEIENLQVVSNLESKEVQNLSQLIYADEKHSLPEHLNGLGYMNILYLLLNIEIIKDNFKEENRDINIFFIEEPEAHTHQQMQYVFIKKIKEEILKEIDNLQTVMSTHSAHIVSQCDFEDIRYFFNHNGKVRIKNFYEELKEKYSQEKEDYFKFLTQYLTLNTSELFFASKIIFIEGTSERFLLPYFIKEYDKNNSNEESLSNQNISILEVGANGRAFKHFLEFLEIKTLIITDIDTTKQKKNNNSKIIYSTVEVKKSTYTSNYTLKYYLDAPDIKEEKSFKEWMQKLKKNELQKNDKNIKVAYQIEENSYHARSFEDAFICINFENIKKYKDKILGLQKKKEIDNFKGNDFYKLTDDILKANGKSDFASSILYLGLKEDDIDWKTPKYIEEGLKWIAK